MKIVISEFMNDDSIHKLRDNNNTVVYDPELYKNKSKLLNELKSANALIIRNQTKVDKDLLSSSTVLKVIGRLGVGLDNIDFQVINHKNIPVVSAKNANANSVAEYVISGMLYFYRPLDFASIDTKKGNWARNKHIGNEIHQKTLGLVGTGEIGHRVALRAKSFGMNVIGYDPFLSPLDFPISETGIELMDLDEVLQKSDFVSVHVPFNSSTKNLITKDSLSKMKSTACLINSSRGGIINENDLAFALKNKLISCAILDVLENEPPSENNMLLTLDNCKITPHISGLTEESQFRISNLIANEVTKELDNKVSIFRVN